MMVIDVTIGPTIVTDPSSGRSRISPPNGQNPSQSLLSVHRNVLPLKRPVVYMMTLLFAILIHIPNSSYHIVHSLTVISTPSTQRPTKYFVSRYDINHKRSNIQQLSVSKLPTLLFQSDSDMTENDKNESSPAANASAVSDDDSITATAATPTIDRTSFDDAGRSLLDEQDLKRMNEMGDFDVNPNSSVDQMDQMRAAIRARTASMGIEKSKVSADYIAKRQQEAMSAGSAKAAAEATSGDSMFGGLDLSQISTTKVTSKAATKNGLWLDKEDEMPSMFYDPEDELSMEERAEVDPIGQKSFVEQGLNELQNAKWPSPMAALREVALMIVIIALTGALIIGWDKVIRVLYTDILHFIPSKQDLANYMNRFDGLELPTGWTDNMNDDDVASFSEKISSVIPTTTDSSSSVSTNLPEL